MQPQDNRDDLLDRPLWELLEHAPKPRIPGNFTDNVLRRIRMEKTCDSQNYLSTWLAQSWKIATGLTAVAALLVSAIIFQENHSASNSLAINEGAELSALLASASTNDLANLGDLDTSLDDNDIWLGTSSY